MHKLVLKYKEVSCDTFLQKIVLTDADIKKVEEESKNQHQSYLWHELRYGRVTASRAYDFSRCKTSDGTLIALIMGGKIPDTAAMKRGRLLEDKVRETVSIRLGKKIKKCGLLLSKEYPMIAGSPDGICEDCIIEIKCPISTKTYKNYILDWKPEEMLCADAVTNVFIRNA
ncbi:Exonuclease [Eumeta japonica]|uniref:Exonuclease n=1 Tax=Eumeta variegata TaxID=151549 RepID=A0A4C1TF11_EUMVA|nr:Exonuclease [Eumeta japonica]